MFAAAAVVIVLVGVVLLLQGQSTSSGQPPAPSAQIGAFAAAIAQEENSPAPWNNPGDLTASFGFPTTGVGNSAGVLIFATPQDGWNALYAQLQVIINGTSTVYSVNDSLYGFGDTYSGGDPNWATNVASILGVDPNSTVGSILGVS